MDAAKVVNEIALLDQAFKQDDKDVIFKVMSRCGASQEEVQSALAAIQEFGFKFSQMDRNSLKVLFLQHLISEMRLSFVSEARNQSGKVLEEARAAHQALLSSLQKEVKTLNLELITEGAKIYEKTLKQAVEVENLIARLDPKGELVSGFAGSALDLFSSKAREKMDELSGDLGQQLSNHSAGIQAQLDSVSNQLRAIEAIRNDPKSISDPVANAITNYLEITLKPIPLTIERVFLNAQNALDASSVALTNVSAEAESKLTSLSNSSAAKVGKALEKSEIAISKVVESSTAALQEKTKWEWVKHAAWIAGGTLLVSFTGMFFGLMVFFKWTYPWLIGA